MVIALHGQPEKTVFRRGFKLRRFWSPVMLSVRRRITMEKKIVDQIFVVTSLEELKKDRRIERGAFSDSVKKSAIKAVSVVDLKENMNYFFNQLREILDPGKEKIGSFELNQVEVSAQITRDGKVCLMGSGVEIGLHGGLKFILKRKA